MKGTALTRIVGVIVILVLGIYGGLASGSGGLDVLLAFQVANAAMLFVLMTVALEWQMSRAS
jgi:hypothetical protein